MDTLFLAVAGLALLLVAVMAAIVARLLLHERRRSEARIAALLSMAEHAADRDRTTGMATDAGRHDAPVLDPVSGSSAPSRVPHDSVAARSMRFAAEDVPSDELELRPADGAVTSAPVMFAPREGSAPWGRRLAIIVPLAVIIVGAGFAFYPADPDIAAPASTAAATGPSAPLELLSLRHTQQADSLTVHGLVQNPRTAPAVAKVFATAFVFAADGTFLASGRAPLDFTTLGPGDESPFVVTVPVKGEVARYRIGFRGEDGRVIAHVDRRAAGAIARAGEERR